MNSPEEELRVAHENWKAATQRYAEALNKYPDISSEERDRVIEEMKKFKDVFDKL